MSPAAVRDEANDARNTAAGTAVAVIATDRDHPACDEVFAWLLSTDRPRAHRSNYATSKISEWLPAGPRVVNRMLSAADSELTFIARRATAPPPPPRTGPTVVTKTYATGHRNCPP